MVPAKPSIPEWFSGRNVVVTGGTGFMGKVLLFKLLDSCPDIGNIYIIIREKKGMTLETRFQKLIEEVPFKTIQNKDPKSLKKLVPVKGDTVIEGLQLSVADKEKILEEVTVFFHMAANVRFDVCLKDAVTTNVIGTRNVLTFATQMPKLESFIHVSTSYCQCKEPILEERPYSMPIDPEDVIKIVQTWPEEVLHPMTMCMLKEYPNTYAFSKALAEVLVQRAKLPSGVIRPSIVSPSFKEPVPGWVDNLNGPTGLTIGASTGVVRSVLCSSNCTANVIPCDFAVNAIIAFSWKVGLRRLTEPLYLNITQNEDNYLSWGTAINLGREITYKYPPSLMIWYPGGGLTSSWISHWTRVILFQYIPAYVLDGVLYLVGYKPFLVRVQHKIKEGSKLLTYYIMKDWVFETRGAKELEAELSPADADTFPINTKLICWEDYLLSYVHGCRQYCLKDDPSTIPVARRRLFYFYCVHVFMVVCFYALIAWYVYTIMMSYSTSTTTVIEDIA